MRIRIIQLKDRESMREETLWDISYSFDAIDQGLVVTIPEAVIMKLNFDLRPIMQIER